MQWVFRFLSTVRVCWSDDIAQTKSTAFDFFIGQVFVINYPFSTIHNLPSESPWSNLCYLHSRLLITDQVRPQVSKCQPDERSHVSLWSSRSGSALKRQNYVHLLPCAQVYFGSSFSMGQTFLKYCPSANIHSIQVSLIKPMQTVDYWSSEVIGPQMATWWRIKCLIMIKLGQSQTVLDK